MTHTPISCFFKIHLNIVVRANNDCTICAFHINPKVNQYAKSTYKMLLEQCNCEHKYTQQHSTHLLQGGSDCSQLWIKAMDVMFPLSHGLYSAPQFCFQWCYFLTLEAIRGHWCFHIFKVKVHYTTYSKIRYPVCKGDHKVYDHGKPGKVI